MVFSDRPMAHFNLLFLSIALAATAITPSHAKQQQAPTFGKCDPTGAVKTLDAELKKGKNLNDAMVMVIKSKQFDGSNACITFIREAAMQQREAAPHAFQKLWME